MKKNHAFIDMIKNNIGILAGLLILCVGLSLLTDKFATTTNFFNIVKQITINLYLACGMTFVILLGGIDLSVGSVIAVAGCVSAGMATWDRVKDDDPSIYHNACDHEYRQGSCPSVYK